MNYHFTAQYEECDGVIIATIPTLKGCVSYGYTLEEAEKNIQEALELYIEDLLESGENIPADTFPSPLFIKKPLSITLPAA